MTKKTVGCKDIGMDCEFLASAEVEEGLMEKVAEHAAVEHGLTEIPPNIKEQLQRSIRTTEE